MNDNYWDGHDIHFAFAPGQSASEASTCCGQTLSTWAGPHAQKDKGWSYTVGYSFTPEEITCKDCIEWMDKNLNKCKCGKIACYDLCVACAAEWFEDKVCLGCSGLKEYCRCK